MILWGIYLSHFIEEATRRESQTNVLIAREETRANNNNTPIYLGIHINHHLSGNVGIYLSVYLSVYRGYSAAREKTAAAVCSYEKDRILSQVSCCLFGHPSIHLFIKCGGGGGVEEVCDHRLLTSRARNSGQ